MSLASKPRSDPEPSSAQRRAAGRPMKGPGRVRGYFRRRHDPLTNLVLVVPVFLVYHLGILFPGFGLRNGVDLVSQVMARVMEAGPGVYALVTLVFAAGLLAAGYHLRGAGSIRPRALLPILFESSLLAVLMLFSVGWAVQQVFAHQIGPRALDPFEKLVMAAGAGFHEELIFRVLLFGGLGALLSRTSRLRPWMAWGLAAVLAGLLFSAVHYVGSMGDELQLSSFTFRFLGGLYLTAVYRFRGFAVAVYTHTLYDLIVFFLV